MSELRDARNAKTVRLGMKLTQAQMAEELKLRGNQRSKFVAEMETNAREISGPIQRTYELLAEKHGITLEK